MNYQFPKSERLNSRKDIEALFKANNSWHEPPIRCLWDFRQANEEVAVKVAFSVPKRLFKKAVERNLLKRRMREAYRLNAAQLKRQLQEKKIAVNFILIYTAPTVKSYKEIEEKIILILQRLNRLNE